MKKIALLAAVLFSTQIAFTQHENQLARKITEHINNNNDTSLFNLFDDNFKLQFPHTEVKKAIPAIKGDFGKILKVDSISSRESSYVYYVTGEKHSVYMILSTAGKKEQISSLLFSPENPFVTIIVSRADLLTDNPIKSGLDRFVDSVVTATLVKSNTPSVSIGIIYNGKEYRYNYGETQIGNKTLPTSGSTYEIGSVTKPFTATLLARLINDKKVSPDDEVNKYLPDSIRTLEYGGQKLLIRHLVNHLGTFPTSIHGNYGAKRSEEHSNPMKYYEKEHLYAYLNDVGIRDTPGIRFNYSNLGYALLGAICENITSLSISTLYNKWIFSPLGMTGSFLNKEKDRGNVLPYKSDGSVEQPTILNVFSPAAAINSNVNDIMKFLKAQIRTESNKKIYKDVQRTHDILFSRPEIVLALGWFVHKDVNTNHYNHSGGTNGFTSRFIFNPERKTGVVVLSNCMNFDSNAIGDAIFYHLVNQK